MDCSVIILVGTLGKIYINILMHVNIIALHQILCISKNALNDVIFVQNKFQTLMQVLNYSHNLVLKIVAFVHQ